MDTPPSSPAPDNIVPLHRGVRPIPTRDLYAIFETQGRANGPTPVPAYDPLDAEAVSWSMLFGAGMLGFVAGLLAVAIPAIILSMVLS